MDFYLAGPIIGSPKIDEQSQAMIERRYKLRVKPSKINDESTIGESSILEADETANETADKKDPDYEPTTENENSDTS